MAVMTYLPNAAVSPFIIDVAIARENAGAIAGAIPASKWRDAEWIHR